jgi:O-antigen/teichoic acid export membrane protein
MVAALLRRCLLKLQQLDFHFLYTAIALGWPLIWYEFTYLILDSGDRVLVNYYLGPQALGYYSAAYNIAATIQGSMMITINLALVPLYMEVWATKGKERAQCI